MTKAELIAAIAAAPDHAEVYIHNGAGILHSRVSAEWNGDWPGQIILEWEEVDAEA